MAEGSAAEADKMACCRFTVTTRGVYVFSLASAYCGLNIGLNYFNNHMFGTGEYQEGIETPFLYSFVNFLMASTIWTPFLCFIFHASSCGAVMRQMIGFLSWASFRKYWYVLIALSFFNVVSITASNASLGCIPLTINQLLKALTIIPMLLLSCIIEGKSYSSPIITTLAIQMAGALIASSRSRSEYTGTGDQALGYLMLTISIVSSAIRPVLVGYVYSVGPMHETGFSPITLVWYDAIFATIGLFPCIFYEYDIINELYREHKGTELWALTIAGSSMALLYNLIVFMLVQEISSLGYMALAQFNTVVLVGGAMLFIDHITEGWVWVGVIVCCLSSAAYAWLRFREQRELREQARKAELAKQTVGAAGTEEEGKALAGGERKAAPTESTPLTEPLVKGDGSDSQAKPAEKGGGFTPYSSGGCCVQ
jgi:drug/metabolite transporter (DMT)-like permease